MFLNNTTVGSYFNHNLKGEYFKLVQYIDQNTQLCFWSAKFAAAMMSGIPQLCFSTREKKYLTIQKRQPWRRQATPK